MSRRRDLSDEERALWSGFARSVTPLRRARRSAEPTAAAANTSSRPQHAPEKSAAASRPAAAPPDLATAAKSTGPARLDRRFKQRIARGREPIDARIDLHGMTQRQAHAALLRFLRRARADGSRTVLVVTGKGSRRALPHDSAQPNEQGVLRHYVPLWLASPEFRLLIVGFDVANVGHGGAGALYVRLRREK